MGTIYQGTWSICLLTGRFPKWYVLPNIILQSSSANCSGTSPFSVPWVPTGINTGVSTTACGRVILHVRAFVVEHFAITCNDKACDLVAILRRDSVWGIPTPLGQSEASIFSGNTNGISPCMRSPWSTMASASSESNTIPGQEADTPLQWKAISLTHVEYVKGRPL